MKNVFTTPVAQGITRRAGLLTLMGSALALAGCGGGGEVAGLSSGGTGSFSVGPITGLGSIIVNGVRFDDSGDVVRDEDGVSRDRSGLKLGMMVTVLGSALSGTSATATSIVFGGELQGPISAKSATTASPQTLTVLGQTVQITGSTIFDVSINGFASLTVNDIVEVHGMVDPVANTIQATFIEKKDDAKVYKIQGLVRLHDSAKKFSIGIGLAAIRINYLTTPAAEVRVIPTDGALVRVRLTTVPSPAPVEWTATRIRPPEGANEDRDEAEIEGSITSFTSPTQFSVNGIAVNASTARFEDGPVALGMRVEVKGRLSGGVLTAERVEIEDDNEIDDLEFELHGTVSNVTPISFTLTSSGGVAVNVSYASTLIINLLNGAKVEVKGTVLNASSASTIIVATRITRE